MESEPRSRRSMPTVALILAALLAAPVVLVVVLPGTARANLRHSLPVVIAIAGVGLAVVALLGIGTRGHPGRLLLAVMGIAFAVVAASNASILGLPQLPDWLGWVARIVVLVAAILLLRATLRSTRAPV